jgi:2-amino-4-hydroxy-6-hydroxymethyldihydropteridine diphosphokinase
VADGSNGRVDAYLSIGSNIEPEKHLRMACDELAAVYGQLSMSSVYQNPPVGFDGDDFLNIVVGFRTAEAPERIFSRIVDLHHQAGRIKQDNPFSSRTLDLDLLLYGDMVRRRLGLPHDDIEKYSFVLRPLAELAPDLMHPVTKVTMGTIWDDFPRDSHPMSKVDFAIEPVKSQLQMLV